MVFGSPMPAAASPTDEAASAALRYWLRPVRRYLDRERVEEVSINRPGEVFVLANDVWTCHEEPVLSFDYCMALARLIATYTHQRLDEQFNLLSASLPLETAHADVAVLAAAGVPLIGERCQIVIPPSCQTGTVCLSFRKHSTASSTLDALSDAGRFSRCVPSPNAIAPEEIERLIADVSTSPEEMELLRHLKSRNWGEFLSTAVLAEKNIVIAGATGSGKTFLTRTLIKAIPATDRIVTIEDTPELPLPEHPNHVHLFYSKNGQGVSKSTPKLLMSACMRLLPSRILLSEVRGDEAWDYLRGLGSGHSGSITTIHANSADEAFAELLKLTKSSQTGQTLSTEDLYANMHTVIDVVLHMKHKTATEIYYNPLRKRQALQGLARH